MTLFKENIRILSRHFTSRLHTLFPTILFIGSALWAIPLLLLFRLLRPFLLIRVGTFWSNRIGHYVADSGQRYAEEQRQHSRRFNIYWLPDKTCNTFWTDLVKRNFKVSSLAYYLDRWNYKLPSSSVHSIQSSYTNSRDVYGLLEQQDSTFSFTAKEELQARNWLRSIGWKDGEPYVVLLNRDSAYLKSDLYVDKLQEDHPDKWNYHSYRNTQITTYLPAAEWLADMGVWVIRMGNCTEQELVSSRSRIFDYSFCCSKSDFLDVWLFANTSLCISTGTGPDMISDVFRRPLLLLNFLPFTNLFFWSNALHAPKTLVWRTTSKELTLREHLANPFTRTEDYYTNGIDIIDLCPQEILQIVQEAWARLNATQFSTLEDDCIQRTYASTIANADKASSGHFIHPNFKISSAYCCNHPDFLPGCL